MFCSPPGRASAQLGPGRVKILRLAFQVTTASQQKKTPLFVFTSAPPATGQLLSRLITQPRAWLDLFALAIPFDTSSATLLAELVKRLAPRTLISSDYALVTVRTVWLPFNPVSLGDRAPARCTYRCASSLLHLAVGHLRLCVYVHCKITYPCNDSP